jgi:hypothetical protein
MAIDSLAKRASVVNAISRGLLFLPLPNADGAIAEADRAHLLGMYVGFDYEPTVSATFATHRRLVLPGGPI